MPSTRAHRSCANRENTTIDQTAANLRSLEGVNKSTAAGGPHRTGLLRFVAFLHGTDCTIGGAAALR